EVSAQEEGMRAGRPLVMPAAKGERLLEFSKLKFWPRSVGRRVPIRWVVGVVVLKIVTRTVVLVFDLGQESILGSDLLFEGAEPLDAVQLVVGANTVVVLVIEVECP